MENTIEETIVEETTTNIELTDAATTMIKSLLEQKNVPSHGLRVFVGGGGCSGLQYGMALEAEPRSYDNIIEKNGIRVFIDPTSMMYLAGAVVDYEESLMGGGFKIENPNAASACGCGSSFKPQGQDQAAPAESSGGSCGSGCGCG